VPGLSHVVSRGHPTGNLTAGLEHAFLPLENPVFLVHRPEQFLMGSLKTDNLELDDKGIWHESEVGAKTRNKEKAAPDLSARFLRSAKASG